MKRALLLFTLAIFISACLHGQDTWKIKVNGNLVLSAKGEDEDKNFKKLSSPITAGPLQISFGEKIEKGWSRTIVITGNADQELLTRKAGLSLTLTAAELKKAVGKEKLIRIYSISLPLDPAVAATIRVRRVHLCTLEFQ